MHWIHKHIWQNIVLLGAMSALEFENKITFIPSPAAKTFRRSAMDPIPKNWRSEEFNPNKTHKIHSSYMSKVENTNICSFSLKVLHDIETET